MGLREEYQTLLDERLERAVKGADSAWAEDRYLKRRANNAQLWPSAKGSFLTRSARDQAAC